LFETRHISARLTMLRSDRRGDGPKLRAIRGIRQCRHRA
jgi:hypothetical protein